MASYSIESTYTPVVGLAGGIDSPETRTQTIASGAGVLSALTVLGRITASKKLVGADTSLANGAEVAYAVLAHDVDATSSDVEATVYITGKFMESDLILVNNSDAIEDFFDHLRNVGIYCTGVN